MSRRRANPNCSNGELASLYRNSFSNLDGAERAGQKCTQVKKMKEIKGYRMGLPMTMNAIRYLHVTELVTPFFFKVFFLG